MNSNDAALPSNGSSDALTAPTRFPKRAAPEPTWPNAIKRATVREAERTSARLQSGLTVENGTNTEAKTHRHASLSGVADRARNLKLCSAKPKQRDGVRQA